MIRKIAIVSLLLLSGLSASALGKIKLVQLGLKAGVNTQTTDLVGPGINNYKLWTDNRTGFHIGLQSRVNLALFHIQPEIVYSMNKYKLFGEPDGSSLPGIASKVRVNSWDFPILAGVKALFFRFQAGPVFNLSTQSSMIGNGGEQAVPDVIFMRSSVSYMLGIGVDILSKITLDVRYNGQFKRPEQSIYINGMDQSREVTTKIRNWMFSVGYMF